MLLRVSAELYPIGSDLKIERKIHRLQIRLMPELIHVKVHGLDVPPVLAVHRGRYWAHAVVGRHDGVIGKPGRERLMVEASPAAGAMHRF
jgi:hypothetical protein